VDFYRKDHQWNPNDGKNQQKIGIGGANINSPSTTWPSQPTIGGPFGGGGVVSESNVFHQIFDFLFRI
jgi:hypothetical protein